MIPHAFLHVALTRGAAPPDSHQGQARHEALRLRSERLAARPSRLRSVGAAVLAELKRMHNQGSAEWAQTMEQRGH